MKNLLPPPWIKFASISQHSIGWRMGAGEDYIYEFSNWFGALNTNEQSQYKRLFKELVTWRGYWDECIQDETSFFHKDFYIDLWECSPRYDLKWLLHRYKAGKKDKFLFFWGYQKGTCIDKSSLSQWYECEFSEDDVSYVCAKQYMMAKKAKCFGDDNALNQILTTRDPKQMKALGRQVKGFDEALWQSVKFAVVLNANYLKFSQNAPLRDFLLSTKDKILVEASPYDKIWGIGMGADDENVQNPMKWHGKNLLGFALMRVRDELKCVYANVNLCITNEL